MEAMDPVLVALRGAQDASLLPAGVPILLAVSGGADSMALLHGAAELAPETGWRLSVAHVHHGWRDREADRDLAFVADHARRLGLPFLSRRVDAAAAARDLRASPEAGARHARYAALLEMAREAAAGRIATAHQHDDALESLALARERRGGIASLAGPRESRADGVVRPLLAVTREEILAYLAARRIGHRRDATNGNLRFSRNRVRRSLAALRAAPGGVAALSAMAEELDRRRAERRRLEADYEEEIGPLVRTLEGGLAVPSRTLAESPLELQRLAILRMAAPFAREGRAPLTGREREALLALLARGKDFGFEAGRRIRFESRAGTLSVRSREAGPMYHPLRPDSAQTTSGEASA